MSEENAKGVCLAGLWWSQPTWPVDDVDARLVRHAVDEGLAEEEVDVVEGGSPDGEAPPGAPHDVPLVGTQAVVGELPGKSNT